MRSPGCSLEGLMLKLKLQYFGHLMRRADSLEKTVMMGRIGGRRRRGRQDEMAGWRHRSDGHEFEQAPGAGDRQAGLACCGPRAAKSRTWWVTQLSYSPCAGVLIGFSCVQLCMPVDCSSLGWQDPLEKEMATHSCILAWKTPWVEEPGRVVKSQPRLKQGILARGRTKRKAKKCQP